MTAKLENVKAKEEIFKATKREVTYEMWSSDDSWKTTVKMLRQSCCQRRILYPAKLIAEWKWNKGILEKKKLREHKQNALHEILKKILQTEGKWYQTETLINTKEWITKADKRKNEKPE